MKALNFSVGFEPKSIPIPQKNVCFANDENQFNRYQTRLALSRFHFRGDVDEYYKTCMARVYIN